MLQTFDPSLDSSASIIIHFGIAPRTMLFPLPKYFRQDVPNELNHLTSLIGFV